MHGSLTACNICATAQCAHFELVRDTWHILGKLRCACNVLCIKKNNRELLIHIESVQLLTEISQMLKAQISDTKIVTSGFCFRRLFKLWQGSGF